MAVCAWGTEPPQVANGAIRGSFETRVGSEATIAVAAAHGEPLVVPSRDQVIARQDATTDLWSEWSVSRRYDGDWQAAVERSALALKLLVNAPSGAIAAAITTSLPERVGGERNWDYRFCWVRDAAFVLRALLAIGCSREADAFFWWLMQASQLTRPSLQVLYRLDGGAQARERTLDLEGYEQSAPVRIGNGAVDQVQLDVYGDVLETAWVYAGAGRRIDRDVAHRLAQVADLVCRLWREPDSGIWEVRSRRRHFTQSKMMCWIALDRACRLADAGHIAGAGTSRWRQDAEHIRTWIEERCWSSSKRSYTRASDGDELDASVLLGILFGYGGPPDRLAATVEAVRRELANGAVVQRYRGDDGLAGSEGAFLACSFWLAEALARVGRPDEGTELFEASLGMSNDLGLYAEEVDPATGRALGNFPQALTHLSLITAATAISDRRGR